MIFFIIPAAIFLADLLIKNYAEKNLLYNEPRPILGGAIILKKVHNKGAMLNFGENHSGIIRIFSSVLSGILFLGYIGLLRLKGYHIIKTAVGFLCGGALSNGYDRIVRRYVVDYFSLGIGNKKLKQIVFNISDIFIFFGAFVAAIWLFIREYRHR